MDKLIYLPLFLLLLLQGCSTKVPPPQEIPLFYPPQQIVQPYTPIEPKKQGPLIIIDPGHGGEDRGTESPFKPSYQEKSLTLTTSRMVRDFLKQMGYQTQMTRDDDTFIPLKMRASMANEAKPALFVSVHYNSAPSKEANGIEIFYYKSETDKERTAASKKLASTILSKVIERTQAKSRGVKAANFAVIRETDMPAILIEGGFLTNQEEMQKIKDPAYIKQLALGIAQGVDQYVQKGRE